LGKYSIVIIYLIHPRTCNLILPYTWPIYWYLKILNTSLYNIITTTVTVEGKNIKLIITLKTAPTTVIILKLVGDISIANIDLQVVTMD
jgi:hypothetical protein